MQVIGRLQSFWTLWSLTPSFWSRTMQCDIAARQCSPCHEDNFWKGTEGSHFALWQAINLDMTGIRCPRFGNSTRIVLDLVNLGRDRRVYTIFKGDLIGFLALNEDRDAGCCLVHAINAANGSILSDRCFRDYHLHYKYTDHSDIRDTFAISESYREICRSFPCAEIL